PGDDWEQTLTLRLRGYDPVPVGTGGGVELEQYAYGSQQSEEHRDRSRGLGVTAAAGPQARFGSEVEEAGEAGSGDHAEGHDGHHAGRPGGREQAELHGDAMWHRSTATSSASGDIHIARVTYDGPTPTYRMTPVFEVTVDRWKGRRRTQHRGLLSVAHAM
ncbi:hypothetical protein, partial [Streptomyces sp. DH37]|uniref:hypothetical protein n=1 Tax=Streptomyces sp. DH37 TaxID=3040122 RepID=UPI002442E935